jgi:NTE family protein
MPLAPACTGSHLHGVTTAHVARRVLLLALAALALATAPVARPGLGAQVGSCRPAPTALVLAGGGAKGFAHIGLLQVLDSLGIVPDYVVGTSIGAIVGSMYASGYTGNEIDSILRAARLDTKISRYDPHVSRALEGFRPVVVWERMRGRWVLQAGAVREVDANTTIARVLLRGNLLARGDFDSLPIPFRAVATDLNTRGVVAIGTGDLSEAVRASFSLPIILRPVRRDSLWLTDGGIASNIPVGVARSLGAQRLIVSTLPSARLEADAFENPLSVSTAVFEWIWMQDSLGLGENDVLVAQPTETFSTLDFDSLTIDSLVRGGRRVADSVFAQGVCARPLRNAHRPRPMPASIGRTRMATANVRDRDAIIRELSLTSFSPLRPDAINRGLERFATSERYRGIWLTPTGSGEAMDFSLRVVPAPERTFGIGLAFDHLMSGRFWAGGASRSLIGDLEGAGLFAAGTYRTDLILAARRSARIGQAYRPVGASLEAFAEDVRIYAGSGELPPAKAEELAIVAGLRPLFESGWTFELGGDYRLWREPTRGTRGAIGARGAIRLREPGEPAPSIEIEGIGLTLWQRVRADIAITAPAGSVEIRPRLRVGYGTNLPIQHTFNLGGLDGFAGMRMFELRGDQEVFASLLVRWRLVRQLKARIEPMAGVVSSGDGFLRRSGTTDGLIFAGIRLGVELDSPVGPLRLEQGFNNQNRRQALIRVGYWF